ncbi:hypothetical protein NTG1052_140131 [Candidatus Nitrotoga sp. 1052]|nr:hypothetical protein NTG1052_140131 [Candidatus Nitrotoga sp. 1052]
MATENNVNVLPYPANQNALGMGQGALEQLKDGQQSLPLIQRDLMTHARLVPYTGRLYQSSINWQK